MVHDADVCRRDGHRHGKAVAALVLERHQCPAPLRLTPCAQHIGTLQAVATVQAINFCGCAWHPVAESRRQTTWPKVALVVWWGYAGERTLRCTWENAQHAVQAVAAHPPRGTKALQAPLHHKTTVSSWVDSA